MNHNDLGISRIVVENFLNPKTVWYMLWLRVWKYNLLYFWNKKILLHWFL